MWTVRSWSVYRYYIKSAYILCKDILKCWHEKIVRRGDNQGGITNCNKEHNQKQWDFRFRIILISQYEHVCMWIHIAHKPPPTHTHTYIYICVCVCVCVCVKKLHELDKTDVKQDKWTRRCIFGAFDDFLYIYLFIYYFSHTQI